MTRSERARAKRAAALYGCEYGFSHANGWELRHPSAHVDGRVFAGEPTGAMVAEAARGMAEAFRREVADSYRNHVCKATGVWPESPTDREVAEHVAATERSVVLDEADALTAEQVLAWLAPTAPTA